MRIFLPTPHNIKVSGSMDTSRYGTKVIFWISGIRGGKRRLIRGNLTQLFMVSLHCVWIYDYFLTFGDEVRYPHVPRPPCQVLTITQIKYAWSGNRSWSEFASTLSE